MTEITDSVSRKEIITWVIQAFSALALMAGAWFFGSLTNKMDELSKAVYALQAEVKVARVERKAIEDLKDRVKSLSSLLSQVRDEQQKLTTRTYESKLLEARIDRLEKKE